jgi:hypothetical protein
MENNMTAPSFHSADQGGPGGPKLTRLADPPAVPYSLRARLTVIASSLAEVVRYAGGWLFDQAMAGWDVAVLTADHADPRPLRILGARAYASAPADVSEDTEVFRRAGSGAQAKPTALASSPAPRMPRHPPGPIEV